jgi:hypothetical protein
MDISEALHRTWSIIGGDILQCEEVEQLPKEEMIDVVLDANYLEMYGGLSEQQVKEFRSLPHAQQVSVAREVFTYDYYGY